MAFGIFISYATGDDENAMQLQNSLSKLESVNVFASEGIHVAGKKAKSIVKDSIDSSQVVIVLLTFNSTNTMWLNQEIGYAFAKNIPIFLIVEKGIDIIGFLEESDYLIYQRGNFKQNIYQVISKLRLMITKISEMSVTNFYVTCQACNNKFLELLPSQELLDKKMTTGENLVCHCKFCSTEINVDPMTLSTIMH